MACDIPGRSRNRGRAQSIGEFSHCNRDAFDLDNALFDRSSRRSGRNRRAASMAARLILHGNNLHWAGLRTRIHSRRPGRRGNQGAVPVRPSLPGLRRSSEGGENERGFRRGSDALAGFRGKASATRVRERDGYARVSMPGAVALRKPDSTPAEASEHSRHPMNSRFARKIRDFSRGGERCRAVCCAP